MKDGATSHLVTSMWYESLYNIKSYMYTVLHSGTSTCFGF